MYDISDDGKYRGENKSKQGEEEVRPQGIPAGRLLWWCGRWAELQEGGAESSRHMAKALQGRRAAGAESGTPLGPGVFMGHLEGGQHGWIPVNPEEPGGSWTRLGRASSPDLGRAGPFLCLFWVQESLPQRGLSGPRTPLWLCLIFHLGPHIASWSLVYLHRVQSLCRLCCVSSLKADSCPVAWSAPELYVFISNSHEQTHPQPSTSSPFPSWLSPPHPGLTHPPWPRFCPSVPSATW